MRCGERVGKPCEARNLTGCFYFRKSKGNMPRIVCLCISDDAGEYDGKKGHTKYQQLALLDQSEPAEARMVNTFDYRMTPAEKELFAGKCLGKRVVMDAKDFEIFNSRLKIKAGKIVEVEGVKLKAA